VVGAFAGHSNWALVKPWRNFQMKKTLIALAVLAVSGTAFAQSTATISGSISTGIMDTGLAGAKAGVVQLGNGANAINIVTVEDLGGGMRGGFDSQMRFSAVTGDANSSGNGNALFHGANAYLSGGFGTLRVGKIIEQSNCAYDAWACTGGAGTMAAAPGTLSALVAAGSQSSSVSYATPSIAGFSANYQTTVSNRTNERQVLSLNYSSGPLTAQYLNAKNGAASGGNGALGAAVAASFDAAASDTKSNATFMGASYAFGFGRVNVGNTVNENAAGTKTSEITTISTAVPMGAYTLLAGYNKAKHIGTTNANNDTKMGVGITYALSKRTSVGADMFKQDAVGSSTGFVTRVRHNF
jgi:hypothetical protein